MKKVFAILAIAVTMVACNNESANTEDAAKMAADSARIADSTAAAQKMSMDTANAVIDSAASKMSADSTKK